MEEGLGLQQPSYTTLPVSRTPVDFVGFRVGFWTPWFLIHRGGPVLMEGGEFSRFPFHGFSSRLMLPLSAASQDEQRLSILGLHMVYIAFSNGHR